MTGTDFEAVHSNHGAYESLTGWWTVKITRSHKGRVTSFEARTYQYRFWKNSTQFQEHYVVNGDTAVNMEFKIISGTGYFKNSTLTHRLTQLQGSFLVTDINKDTVTITLQNDYIRNGIDSIVTKRITRILTHTVTIFKEYTQIHAPRFFPSNQKPIAHWRNEFHKTVSGIMHGHISAGVTMLNGEYYTERTIDKDFTVTFAGNNGEGSISLGNNGSLGRFRFYLETGNGN
jgi:hypothetical protein